MLLGLEKDNGFDKDTDPSVTEGSDTVNPFGSTTPIYPIEFEAEEADLNCISYPLPELVFRFVPTCEDTVEDVAVCQFFVFDETVLDTVLENTSK